MAACGIAPEDDDANAACRPVAKPVAKPSKHASELKAINTREELVSLYKSLPEATRLELKDEFSARRAELEAA
jgi:hypothetical protein